MNYYTKHPLASIRDERRLACLSDIQTSPTDIRERVRLIEI
jgi:hypothetical protein